MSVEAARWGIIYCPKEGTSQIHKQWEEICAYLTEKKVAYDFVQSESSHSVERLAAMIHPSNMNVNATHKITIIYPGASAISCFQSIFFFTFIFFSFAILRLLLSKILSHPL